MKMLEILETTADWKPRRYFQKIDGGIGTPYLVRGELAGESGQTFHVTVEAGGKIIKQKTFDLSDLTFPQLADQLIRTEEMSVGKNWTFKVINPADFLPIRISISVDRAFPMVIRGVRKTVFQVTARMGTIEILSFVDTAQAEPYRIETPAMGLVYVMEDKETAANITEKESASLDLFYFAAVVPTGGKAPKEDAERVRVRLHGARFDGLHLAGDFQTVEIAASAADVTLDIRLPDLGLIDDVKDRGRPSAGSAGTDDTSAVTPAIREVADTLRQPTPLAFTKAAVQWMQKNIRQVPTSIVPAAADVLDLKQGDCNEFSALFHALATAAGFPCKIASGVVFMDGRYFYHSWNEILAGGRWVPVDPIFDEIPASPKHIKLIEGDFSATWRLAGCLKTLQIEILPD